MQIQRAKYLGVVIFCFNLGSWGLLIACNSGSPALFQFNHFCRSVLLCVQPLLPAVWGDFLKNKSSAQLLTLVLTFRVGNGRKGWFRMTRTSISEMLRFFFLKQSVFLYDQKNKISNRAPLVAQWKRMHWPMQKTWVWSLGGVEPTCN